MAPNRRAKNDHGGNHGGSGGGGAGGGGGGPAHNQRNGNQHGRNGMASSPMKCVRPKGCLEPKRLIYMEDIESGSIEVVRVACNNLQCEQGNYMHSECFADWETSVLNFLSSTGRARSWSVKQRQQNLWTKKGYDISYRACGCNCGKGHLRKDLDWISPTEKLDRIAAANPNPPAAPAAAAAVAAQAQEEVAAPNQHNANNQNRDNAAAVAAAAAVAEERKKKKKKAKENLPTLSLSAPVPHPNDNHSRKVAPVASAPIKATTSTSSDPTSSSSACNSGGSAGSSSSSGIGSFGSSDSDSPSPPSSGPWNLPESASLYRDRVNSLSSNASGSSGAFSAASGSGSPPSPGAQFGSPASTSSMLAQNFFKFQRKNSNGGDRIRHNSTGSLFCRRNDFSSFNFLPKQKQNSYHIKMDDDGHGNDDMRFVVLATLQNQRMTKVNCCMCQSNMIIYDRYPLIDGTFFIAPRKYGKESIPMMTTSPTSGADGVSNTRYLTAICMHCLSGKQGGYVCRGCGKAFDGTAIIIGAIYSYDVFASMACCRKRVECGNCRAVLHSEQYKYFCQGSNLIRCYRCGFMDFHFAKALESVYERVAPDQFDKILRMQK
ncbi:headcase protein [Folsomia candida]|nr:headcase protein [Folsomia candida]